MRRESDNLIRYEQAHYSSIWHRNFRKSLIEKQRKQFTTLSAYFSIGVLCRLKIMNIEIWIPRILRAWTKSRGLCMRVFDRVSRVFVTFKVAQLLGKLSLKDVSDLLRYILFFDLLQNVFQLWIPYVNQHISVSTMFHSHRHVLILTTVIVFDRFLLRATWYDVIVEFTPLSQNRWISIHLFCIHLSCIISSNVEILLYVTISRDRKSDYKYKRRKSVQLRRRDLISMIQCKRYYYIFKM